MGNSELLRIIRILKDNGIDVTAIQITSNSESGKRIYLTLKDIKQPGIDINTIIDKNELDRNYPIGRRIKLFRDKCTGTKKGKVTFEERRMAEEMGILKKILDNRQQPLFKGRKISQFHIDIVKANIERILSGELTNNDVIVLINRLSSEHDETPIEDSGTIRRIVEIVLKESPEQLARYEEQLRDNIGATRGNRIRRNDDTAYIYMIINTYIPKYISGEISLETIEKELGTTRKTIESVIYENASDSCIKAYEKKKQENFRMGTSQTQRANAQKMRSEVAGYEVVSNPEFLLLTEEEQDMQILMKIRQSKLKEEINGQKKGNDVSNRVVTEETTKKAVQKIKEYFRSKNNPQSGVANFSEQDIRFIIFRYPTITSRTIETLDEKLDTFLSYDSIDERTAYGMVKTYPAIMGFSVKRTKSQLDLLKKENLIDSVISNPRKMMISVEVMYALIEYAKERHKTSDLSDINRSNIFMPNGTLRRVYKTSYEELLKRFPYPNPQKNDEEPITYQVTGEDLGKVGNLNPTIQKIDKAAAVVATAVANTKEGQK